MAVWAFGYGLGLPRTGASEQTHEFLHDFVKIVRQSGGLTALPEDFKIGILPALGLALPIAVCQHLQHTFRVPSLVSFP